MQKGTQYFLGAVISVATLIAANAATLTDHSEHPAFFSARLLRARALQQQTQPDNVQFKNQKTGQLLSSTLVNLIENRDEFDYLITDHSDVDSIVPLNANDLLELYEIKELQFNPCDFSTGIDFESAATGVNFVGNYGGTAEVIADRPISGKYSLRLHWNDHDGAISLLPGERDWRNYAELRFTLHNPMPTVLGKRTRMLFFFDGKKVFSPSHLDTIPGGALILDEESSKTFHLDLSKMRQNVPDVDWSNITAMQFFWSPTVCGETILYLDDLKLLTREQLDEEIDGKYRRELDELQASIAAHASNDQEVQTRYSKLEEGFATGQRTELDAAITDCREYLLTAQLNATATADQNFTIVAADVADKIMRDTAFPYQTDTFSLAAAGNERESFQLVLVPRIPLKNVTVSASDLTTEDGSTLSAQNIRINPVGYIEVTNAFYYPESRTGYWPDVLLDNQAFDLPVKVQPYVITVAVPARQQPGIYRGNIHVAAEGEMAQDFPYTLEVYPFSLPQKGSLKTFFSCSYAPHDRAIRHKVFDQYFLYRLNPVSMYNRIQRDTATAPGTVPAIEDLDYCLERGLNLYSMGHLLDLAAEDPNTFNDEYISASLKWLSYVQEELKKRKCEDIGMTIGFDEIMHLSPEIRDPRLREAEKILSAIKKSYPDIANGNIGRVMTISPQLMDWWYTEPVPVEEYEHIQKAGGHIGLYWAYQNPSFMLDLPGIAPRIISWMAYKQKAEAIGYYSTFRPHEFNKKLTQHQFGPEPCNEECISAPTPHKLDITADELLIERSIRFARNGDGQLFYPADDGSLLASFRLINLRDGIEDYEYMKMLEAYDPDHPLLKIPDDIVTILPGNYTRDISVLKEKRAAIAKAIAAAMQ